MKPASFVVFALCSPAAQAVMSIKSQELQSSGDDQETLALACAPDSNLGLHNESVWYSNLGGHGPDERSLPDSIRLWNVFPKSGYNLDMVITAETAYFGTATLNGMRDEFVGISVHSGSSTRLRVTFVNRLTEEVLNLSPVVLTLQGLTSSFSEQGRTSVRVVGSSGYNVAEGSPLTVVEDGKNYTVIAAGESSCNPGHHSLHLTECQMATSISMRFEQTHDIVLEFHTAPGDYNPIFYLGGPSNIDCPEPALCSTFTCPEFHQRRVSSADNKLYCAGEVCEESDTNTCCETVEDRACSPDAAMILSAGSLAWSNLGGLGPDLNQPHSIYFDNVFPGNDPMLDLEITNITEYTPANVEDNRQSGSTGVISVEQGTEVRLNLAFFKSGTQRKMTLSKGFVLSFLELGMPAEGESRESVEVERHMDYRVSPHSNVRVDDDPRKQVTFTATEIVDDSDSAVDLYNLTEDQLNRVASAMFKRPKNVRLTLRVSAGASGRKFRFAGWSQAACPAITDYCAAMQCPRGYFHKASADQLRCQGPECTDVDITTCCESDPHGVCASTAAMTLSETEVEKNNLAGKGPMEGKKEIRIRNVFPHLEERVDMSVRVPQQEESRYIPHDSSKNGVENGFLRINMKSGTNTFINMRFHDSSGGRRMIEAFYMTIADLDSEHDGGSETVRMKDFDYYNVSSDSALIAAPWRYDGSGNLAGTYTSFSSQDYGVEMDNPSSIPAVLEWSKRRKAVTFYYVNTSEVNMHLHVSYGVGAGRSLLIAGSSSLSCPSIRASCVSMLCPGMRRLKQNAASLECNGPTCGEMDVELCCANTVEGECDARTALVVRPENLVYSNLAGAGPDEGTQVSIYHDVFPHCGRLVNMVMSNESECALGSETTDAYASLVLRSGTSCRVKFSFIDQVSGSLVSDMWHYHFTFLGLDSEATGNAAQQVFFEEVVGHTIAGDSALSENRTKGHKYGVGFKSAETGPHVLTSSPFKLSNIDKRKSAAVLLSSNAFIVELSVSSSTRRKDKWRTFRFAGDSSLRCPPRATCTTDMCPAGLVLAPGMEGIPCAGAECTDADTSFCCMPVECTPERSFNLASVAVSNLGYKGPDRYRFPIIRYTDVFPRSGNCLDLIVRHDGEYYANNASKNGLNGEFGQVNVQAGSGVNLTFHFVRSGTTDKVKVPSFYFSLFDVDGQRVQGKESAIVQNYASFETAFRGELVTNEFFDSNNGNTVSIFSTAFGNEGDNPAHPLALNWGHLNRSITFRMPDNTGSFHVSFTAEEGWAGRNLLFGGPTNLVCSGRALCSTFTCPTGSRLRESADRQVCSTNYCRRSDALVCCEQDSASTPGIA